MSPDINLDLYIPQVWYDVFARLLPGVTFVSAVRVLVFPIKTPSDFPDFKELIVLAFAGYISGLIAEAISIVPTSLIEIGAKPIFSWLIKEHRCLAFNGLVKNWNNERENIGISIGSIQRKPRQYSTETLLLSKMHAEIKFFVQLIVLSLVFLGVKRLASMPLTQIEVLGVVVVVLIGLLGSFLFAVAREKLARQLENANQ